MYIPVAVSIAPSDGLDQMHHFTYTSGITLNLVRVHSPPLCGEEDKLQSDLQVREQLCFHTPSACGGVLDWEKSGSIDYDTT